MRSRERTVLLVVVTAALVLRGFAQIPEQYPKPLIHTPANHPAQRALVLIVNGLHAFDLSGWVVRHPDSALAELSSRGVTYTNATAPLPNAAAGMLAVATGGTAISTGIAAGDGYDRALAQPGSRCEHLGTSFSLDAMMRTSSGAAVGPLDPAHGCAPVRPHDLLRVNTIFEVVHEKIGPTAWAGSNSALTDLLRGPSGRGLDTSCEVPDDDEARAAAIVFLLEGHDCTGQHAQPVPALFGMDFTSVAAAEPPSGRGYVDAAGTPSPILEASLATVDGLVGGLILTLKKQGLFDTTWIFLCSSYGGGTLASDQIRTVPSSRLWSGGNGRDNRAIAHISISGDQALVWLHEPQKTNAVVKNFLQSAQQTGIDTVLAGDRLAVTWNKPTVDSRAPDILLRARRGVIWQAPNPASSQAGNSDDGAHVALLISGSQLTARADPTPVPITQVAPLLLRSLGMEKFDLQALHREHTPALPGIF